VNIMMIKERERKFAVMKCRRVSGDTLICHGDIYVMFMHVDSISWTTSPCLYVVSKECRPYVIQMYQQKVMCYELRLSPRSSSFAS
jgi:hypothetical protein